MHFLYRLQHIYLCVTRVYWHFYEITFSLYHGLLYKHCSVYLFFYLVFIIRSNLGKGDCWIREDFLKLCIKFLFMCCKNTRNMSACFEHVCCIWMSVQVLQKFNKHAEFIILNWKMFANLSLNLRKTRPWFPKNREWTIC